MKTPSYTPAGRYHNAFTEVDKIQAQLETATMQLRLAQAIVADKPRPKSLTFKERLKLRDQARNLAKKGK